MSGESERDVIPHDEASYLILDAEWRILAADEAGSLAADTGPLSLRGRPVHEVIGADALAALRATGTAVFALESVEYVLTAHSFELADRTLRVVRAQEMQATMEHVVSFIVHEIRNPLSAMRALAQGLEETLGGRPDATPYTSRLTGEIDRLSRLLVSMAQVARPRARPRRVMALGPLLERVAAIFQPELERRGIQIQVNITSRCGPILADPDQIHQLLVNLIANAAEAMPAGGTITLRARLDPRGRAQLQVEDTGVGMAPDEVERALRPGQSSKPGGMGLGLMIVLGIVRQHHGRMRITSVPGRGTSVAITFPAAAPVSPHTSHPPASSTGSFERTPPSADG
jgi:signal transduction histidine kinase